MMKTAQLTVLVNNTVQRHSLLAEHGLSFWMKLDSTCILFDAGQTNVIRRNAELLGIELDSADMIVLSHGHYDHTGGLDAVLQTNAKQIRVFAHPEAFADKYSCASHGAVRDIGIPVQSRQALRKTADIIPTESPVEIAKGLFVTGPVPRISDYEDVGGPFFKDKECRQRDDLVDDQAIFFDAPAGIVVILGCAHAGIVNTLHYVMQLIPGRPIHTVIGGTHLVNADESRMDRTVAALREFDITRLMPIHCTGFAAAARLWNEFPGRVSITPVGTEVELIQ